MVELHILSNHYTLNNFDWFWYTKFLMFLFGNIPVTHKPRDQKKKIFFSIFDFLLSTYFTAIPKFQLLHIAGIKGLRMRSCVRAFVCVRGKQNRTRRIVLSHRNNNPFKLRIYIYIHSSELWWFPPFSQLPEGGRVVPWWLKVKDLTITILTLNRDSAQVRPRRLERGLTIQENK